LYRFSIKTAHQSEQGEREIGKRIKEGIEKGIEKRELVIDRFFNYQFITH
jgi:hypothetical protein